MPQGSLLDCLSPDSASVMLGLAGVMPEVRAAMGRVAREYPEGRKSLPDAITEVAQRENVSLTSKGGKTVSLETVNKWCQQNATEHRPTLEAILCFCAATGDYSPLFPLLKPAGLAVIPAAKLDLLRYGEACAAEEKAREAKRKIKARL